MRFVFNASLNAMGPFLNGRLCPCPSLCEILLGLLRCFFLNNIAFISDIKKVFFKILRPKNDHNFV